MKKIIVTIFALIVSFSLFAESKSYLSLNASFGNIGISKKDSYNSSTTKELNFNFSLNGSGLAFQSYTFWNNKNVGLFSKMPITFGIYNFTHQDMPIPNSVFKVNFHTFKLRISPSIGIGFKKKLSENWIFLTGFGTCVDFDFAFFKVIESLQKKNRYELEFNISNNLEFKYLINESFGINLGLDTTLAFAKFSIFTMYDPIMDKQETVKKWQKPFFSLYSSLSLGVSFLVN